MLDKTFGQGWFRAGGHRKVSRHHAPGFNPRLSTLFAQRLTLYEGMTHDPSTASYQAVAHEVLATGDHARCTRRRKALLVIRFLAGLTIGAAMTLSAVAPAMAEPSVTVTVDGVDYPVCVEEDCSDQPGQTGVWTNKEGVSYLELGEGITLRITPEV